MLVCTVTGMQATKDIINNPNTLHGQILQTTDSSKYLRVALSDDLKLQKRVHMITTNVNMILGIILGDMVRPTLVHPSMGPKASETTTQSLKQEQLQGYWVCPLNKDLSLCDKDGAGSLNTNGTCTSLV